MKKFKFLSRIKVQYVPIHTSDTDTTYHIPLDLYGHILQLAVDLHSNNLALFSQVEYRIINEIGQNITYLYRIDNITQISNNPVRIKIEYSIRFPDTEYYNNFQTTERLSLYETI